MPYMKDKRYGRLVTISSGTVLIGMPGQSAYIASKSGIIGFTRAFARARATRSPSPRTASCLV
jgi:NAD(P)-dependent dehydrogenase (short-subunit alcohol dehydrogenase family)